jgi:hypothetical protein
MREACHLFVKRMFVTRDNSRLLVSVSYVRELLVNEEV